MAENSQAVIPDNLIIVDGEIGGGVPSSSPSDAGKVLTVDSEGDPSWVTPSGGTQYSEGNGIDISNENVISVDTTVVATQSDLSGYQPTISDLETIRSGASAGATAVQPGSLATVATSGSYADLSNKPTIPTVDQSYNAASTNAQSGTAVAQAIAAIPSSSYTAGEGIDITANEVSVKAGRNLGFEPLLTTVTLQSPTYSVSGGSGYAFLGKLDADTVALLKSGTVSLTPKYDFTISMTGIINSGARFAICQSSGYNQPNGAGKWLISDNVLSESGATSFVLTADTAYTVDFSSLSSKSTGTWTDVEANPTSFYLALVAYSSQYDLTILREFGHTSAISGAQNPGDTSSYAIGDPTDLYLYAKDQLPSISGNSGKVLKVNVAGTATEWADESTELPASTSADNGKVLGVTDTSGTLGWVAQTPAQVNADWNAASGVSQIMNKPSLATVATSGSYNDLSNKPSIPAAQIQSDWDQTDNQAVDFIKNKPTIPAAQVNSDWNAVSGVSQILNKPSLATVATSGSYADLSNKPTIPTVDQSYSASSTNAQSGVAVANAISAVKQVPSSTSTDEGKVLTVNSSGNAVWDAAPATVTIGYKEI